MTEFPALGFDPAPGSAEAVESLAHSLNTVASRLEEAHQAVRAVSRAGAEWQGEAAESFSDTAGDLPGHLERAGRSLYLAAKALSRWAQELTDLQRRSRSLELQAQQAQRRLAAAEANPISSAWFSPKPGEEDAYLAARRQLAEASTEYEGLRTVARLLHEQHLEAAAVAERAVRDASGDAPNVGILGQFGDLVEGVWNRFAAHDRMIAAVGDVLGDIAAVCGVVSLVMAATGFGLPFAGVVAGVGAGASGLALIAHGVSMAGGNRDVGWDDLAMDGLGVATFGVANFAGRGIRAGKELRNVLKEQEQWREATEVLQGPVRNWRRVTDINWWTEQGALATELGKTALEGQFRELWDVGYWSELKASPDSDPVEVPVSDGAEGFWRALEAPTR